jgi:hypothetical protein
MGESTSVERLIELRKEMAPALNDLMCFFRQIGHFREIDPPAALSCKRRVDRIFYANEHLFGPVFRQKYRDFMGKCFAMWESAGEDAKMKSSAIRLRNERGRAAPAWNDDWDRLFENVPPSRDRRRDQQAAYNDLMSAFADELGLSRTHKPVAA